MTTVTSSATATPTQTSTTTWNIDPAHSIAEFKVKHMMIANVKGQFSRVSGALLLDASDLANSSGETHIGLEGLDQAYRNMASRKAWMHLHVAYIGAGFRRP